MSDYHDSRKYVFAYPKENKRPKVTNVSDLDKTRVPYSSFLSLHCTFLPTFL